MDAIEAASAKRGEEYVNLALLTDGLRAEREQGITIDVAYRYFSTPKRKFIIADTPGHIQYTRNMVTGASTANLAIILVDARKGIIEQTYRHSYIASLLQIPHIIVAINKMDLVNWDEKTFNKIVQEYKAFASKLDIKDVHFIPISALEGDNVVNRSEKLDWYKGPTLLYLLETIHIGSDINHIDARFPVQYVIRPMKNDYHDFRGYAGRIAGGAFRVGDKVKALPSGFSSKIKSIVTMDGDLQEAFAPQSVTITLEDEIDISRGDMIVRENNVPQIEQEFDVMLCWMNEKKLVPRGKYILRHTSRECKCIIKEAKYKLNINTLQRITDDIEIGLNDIARVSIRTTVPLFFDSYRKNRITGSIILVDESTNETVAAGMIV
jgi:sulfate adenylyltransferase subunit 1